MKSKKHLKKLKNSQNNINNNNINEKNKIDDEYMRDINYYEYQITHYKDILQNIIDNTIGQIRKKQTMTREELETDRQNELNLKKIEKEEKGEIKPYLSKCQFKNVVGVGLTFKF